LSVKKKLIKNTIVNYAIRFWGFIITFILLWYIVKQVGDEDYGIYLFITAIIGYFGMLDLGIGNSHIKFIAEYYAKKDEEKLNEVINTTFFIFLIVGIVGAVILFIIGTFLLTYLESVLPALESPDFHTKARTIIYILAANFIFSLSLTSLRGVLAGLQRYDIIAVISVIMSLVNITVVFLVLSSGYGIIELVFYQTATGLFAFILVAVYIRRLLPFVSLKFSYLQRKMLRTLLRMSMSVFLLTVFVSVIYYTDRVVIALFVDIGLVTSYYIAWKLYLIPAQVPAIGLYAMIPAASELDAKQDFKALKSMFLRGTKYVIALCFALAVPVIFLSREILILWMGAEYGQFYLIVIILIIALFFDFNNYVASQILIGMNRIKKFVKYYGITALLNLGLSLFLVSRGYGLVGVALGTTIPFVVMEVFFLRHTFKVLGIKWREYARGIMAKTLPYAGMSAAVMLVLLLIHRPDVQDPVGLMNTIIASIVPGTYFIIGFIVFIIPFYYKGLDDHERQDIRNILSNLKLRKKSMDTKTDVSNDKDEEKQ